MKRMLKQVSGLFFGSGRYLFILELVYKLIGAVVVFPLCEMLLHVALKFSKVYYISSQNIWSALTDPLMLLAFLIILLIFLSFVGFEVFCLVICYQQTWYKRPIGYYHLLKEGFHRSRELFRPRNWLLFPVLAILFPSLFYFLQNSSNNYTTLTIQLFRNAFLTFPVNILTGVLLGLFFLLSIIGMFSLQIHMAQHTNGYRSIRKSTGILLRNFKQIIVDYLVWLLFIAVIVTAVNAFFYGLIWLGVRVFVQQALRAAMRATLNHYAAIVLNFMTFSVVSFASFCFSAAFYYAKTDPERKNIPDLITDPSDPKGKLKGGITFGSIALAFVLTIVVNLAMLYSAQRDGLSSSFFSEKVAIVSHRGVTAEAKENTLGSIQAAIDTQADFVEFDCQLTKDGEVALLHDKTMRRCWNVDGVLSDYTTADLLNITNIYGEHLPTLREVFELCKEQNIKMLIELKVNAYNKPEELAEAVVRLIEEYELRDWVMIQSFSYKALTAVKTTDPTIVCGYLMNGSIGMYYDLENADFFSVNLAYVTENIVSSIHLRDKKLLVWTVNTRARMERSIDYHVDGIITDDPITARERVYGNDLLIENILPEEETAEAETNDR